MKTTIKIVLLIFVGFAAVVGVYVYAKTRVAPPSSIEIEDQYIANLDVERDNFESLSDFTQSHNEYIRLDDKLQRLLQEEMIDSETSDEYRTSIDLTYGNRLTDYSFSIFQNPEWPDNTLNGMLAMVDALNADRLTTGKEAAPSNFSDTAKKLHGIVNDYHDALRLSKNTSFRSVSDATSTIKKARDYRSQTYLKNNAALTSALDALPGKIAQSHYYHVDSQINKLGNYRYMSENEWDNLNDRVNAALNEFKSTNIYGSSKPNVSNLDSKAEKLIYDAASYYDWLNQQKVNQNSN